MKSSRIRKNSNPCIPSPAVPNGEVFRRRLKTSRVSRIRSLRARRPRVRRLRVRRSRMGRLRARSPRTESLSREEAQASS
jgi:hypothetical protein